MVVNVSTKFLVAIIFILLFGYNAQAASGCIVNQSVITGELQEVITRDIKRNEITKYHLVLPKARCVRLANKKKQTLSYVKHIELRVSNSRPDILRELVGLKMSVRGNHFGSKSKSADAVVRDARILGAYDPRNGRFHHWKDLEKKVARLQKRKPQPKPQPKILQKKEELPTQNEVTYSLHEKKKLKDIIEKEELPRERIFTELDDLDEDRNVNTRIENDRSMDQDRSFKVSGLTGGVREDIIAFIEDEYLQFHQMLPEDVTSFYAPVIDYNGTRGVVNEAAVRRKFIYFRKFPGLDLKLLLKSLRIEENYSQDGVYKVSFIFKSNENRFNAQKWTKKRVELTLDIGDDDVLIRKERVSLFDRPYS